MNTKLILLSIFGAALTACSSSDNSAVVKDNWPGIDGIYLSDYNGQAQLAQTDQFNFSHYITVPKMGKNVSYSFTSTCIRGPRAEGTQKTYQKTTEYKHDEKTTLKPLALIDHLPEEVLIFPEHFEACDFKLSAQNDIGSTDNSELTGIKLVINDEIESIKATNSGLKADSPNVPLSNQEFEFIDFTSEGKELSNTKFICYSNKIKKSDVLNNLKPKFNGKALSPLPTTTNYPLEYCVVTGTNEHSKALVSNRFRIYNRGFIWLSQPVHTNDLFTQNIAQQIRYEKNTSSDLSFYNLEVLKVDFYNASTDIQYFSFGAADSVENIYLVEGVNQKSQSAYTPGSATNKTYSMKLRALKTYHSWVNVETGERLKSFELKPREHIVVALKVFPDFSCKHSNGVLLNEIGFVVAPSHEGKLMEMQQISKNDFITESFLTGDLLESHNIISVPSNLPEDSGAGLSHSTSFELMYRNKNSYKNEDLVLKYKEFPTVYDNNGELANVKSNFESYTFGTTGNMDLFCKDNLDFYTTGVDPTTQEPILRPLNNR